ncbi:MAG: hypothetical protein ACR2QE_02290 [Acidimicrobiales bacterium]
MDPRAAWLRNRIVRSLVRRSLVVAGVSAVVAHLLLLRITDVGGWALLGWSLLIGQVLALARLGVAVVANPLNYGYLRHYIAQPCRLVPAEVEGDQHTVAGELELLGLEWGATVHDPEVDPAPVFDLYQGAADRVLAGLSRATGDVTLVSCLTDGRILHTSSLLLPPHGRLVINTAPAADPLVIWGSHHQALAVLAAHGVQPTHTTASAFRDAMAHEHEAYAGLGPVLGSFYDPGRQAVAPMTVAVSPTELLEVSLPS